MRELELHPPAEDWNRRTLVGVPGSTYLESDYEEAENLDPSPVELWPRKRRRVEHDAAFGLQTAVGLGSFTTLLGSRRDVVTSQWNPPTHGAWHKVCLYHLNLQFIYINWIFTVCRLSNFINFLLLDAVFALWSSDSGITCSQQEYYTANPTSNIIPISQGNLVWKMGPWMPHVWRTLVSHCVSCY